MKNQELSVYKIITMSPYEAHMTMINEIEKEFKTNENDSKP